MKVIILAGGHGTRLVEETENLPKPMIEIGGRPLLWHLMKMCCAQGFNEFIIALGYKGQMIKRYFLHYRQLESDLQINLKTGAIHTLEDPCEDWIVDLVNTGRNTMTGGRVKRLRHLINDTIILTYGDGLANVDLNQLVAYHRAHGKLATVTAVLPPASRFGQLEFDGKHVTSFQEKPNQPNTWINGGFFVLEPAALDYIEGDLTSWEREPCQKLAQDKQLMVFHHQGYWQCVDILHELRQLRELWNNGQAPWKMW
ncbi:MAG: glucose-1-phosphate cytidylyltransferase [Candidatus Parabeggiatoa sp. nov. 3]|nr:MAG: glucose-1-phosphate cytidylyltransferase [Gammaproteobacteria bacterium]RKZ61756.1 MAG: glucose-1-phosphate cytidylyltransferase [Gammaproteobacteria bacterium]RKZ88859.1 MAG: glucose-1-phosphate cytidylyltransferase [Gammaproteobacteria bacterium]